MKGEISSLDGLFQESRGITTVELTKDEEYSFSLGALGIGVAVILFVVLIVILCIFKRNR